MAKRNLEMTIQRHLVQWCRKRGGVLEDIFSVPNEGARSVVMASLLKQAGLTPGWPDLGIPLDNGRVYWLELKTKSGRLSEKQKAVHEKLRAKGHEVAVAYGFDAAKALLQDLEYREQPHDTTTQTIPTGSD